MRILILDDDPAERLLTIEALRSGLGEVEFVEVAGPEEFKARLAEGIFDLVVTEYSLGWADGLQILKTLKSRFKCVPVIMLTSHGSEEIAVAGMKGGLADYVPKQHRQRLVEEARRWMQSMNTDISCDRARNDVSLCERWDIAISRLTSDYAYSVRIDPEGGLACEWVTEPFSRVTGYTLQQVHERGEWLAPVFPDDQPAFERWLDKLRAGYQDTCDYRILTSSGEVRWLRDHAMPVRDWVAGRVVRIYGAAQDVSDRSKAESERQLMQRAIESSNNGIIITGAEDTDYGIIYANSAFQRMTGYTIEELRGRNCRFLQGDDLAQPELEALRGALRDARDGHAELRNYRKDGSPFWNEVYISPVFEEHGRVRYYIGVQNDVTERKLSEAKLAESAREIQDLYDHALCGYQSLSPDGTFLRINATELQWLGYGREEVVGKMNFRDVLTPASRANFNRRFPKLKKIDHIKDLEFDLLRKDGSILPVLLSATAILDEQGHYLMSRSVVYDMTDRKRAEDAQYQLSRHLQSAREEERTRISREIHDHFGSLLASLKLDVRWLSRRISKENVSLKVKTTEMSGLIDEAMQSVRKISTDLRPSILDNLGLLAAIEWQVNQFIGNTGIACKLSMPKNEDFDMDSERATAVFRILQEALTNISLHAQASQAEVRVRINKRELTMTIADNGKGITRQSLASPQSVGICGMTERARNFDGVIHISGKPNAGTAVVLHIPRTPGAGAT